MPQGGRPVGENGMAELARTRPSTHERLREIIADLSLLKDRTFKLASGRESGFFFDLKPTMLDPEGINLLADEVIDQATKLRADCIGGLVLGAVPIVVAAVLKSKEAGHPLKGFWVRKEAKDHGALNLTDGHLAAGSRVVIIEDVTTTGGSAMKAVAEARRQGGDVVGVITVVDRLEGARENFKKEGIDLIALFDKNDFL